MKDRYTKAEKIQALARIRDYMRANVELIPAAVCDDFNLVAKAIGVEQFEGWCTFGIKRSEGGYIVTSWSLFILLVRNADMRASKMKCSMTAMQNARDT